MAKILLLEPDVILARQYETALLGAGHTVAVCHDAQGAILGADAVPPDLVILEVLLAAHSGVEFLYEFRSYGEWQHIPALILSRAQADELAADQDLQRSLGVHAVLYKPDVTLEKLVQVVGRTVA